FLWSAVHVRCFEFRTGNHRPSTRACRGAIGGARPRASPIFGFFGCFEAAATFACACRSGEGDFSPVGGGDRGQGERTAARRDLEQRRICTRLLAAQEWIDYRGPAVHQLDWL